MEIRELGYDHKYVPDDHGNCRICQAPSELHYRENLKRIEEGIDQNEIVAKVKSYNKSVNKALV